MKKFFTILLTFIFLSYTPFVFALEEVEDLSKQITITKSQLPLSSKLKKEYNAYKYDIVNNSNQEIYIVNAQIVNGVNGNIASNAVDHGSGVGYVWAFCGPIGLITLGIGWAVGLAATPIVWSISSSRNKKAKIEGMAYSNIVDLGYLSKGESTSVQTLVPIGTQPQIRLTIQGQDSRDLIMVNR